MVRILCRMWEFYFLFWLIENGWLVWIVEKRSLRKWSYGKEFRVFVVGICSDMDQFGGYSQNYYFFKVLNGQISYFF